MKFFAPFLLFAAFVSSAFAVPSAPKPARTIIDFNPGWKFLQSDAPFTWAYPVSAQPVVVFSPAALPQGVSSMVSLTSSQLQFVNGLTTLGFG